MAKERIFIYCAHGYGERIAYALPEEKYKNMMYSGLLMMTINSGINLCLGLGYTPPSYY